MAKNGKDWAHIEADQAYKMQMSEFKGATIHALQDLKEGQDTNANKIDKLDTKVGNLKLISGPLGAIGGIIVAVLAGLRPK